jgi:hypothetical protein
MNRVIQPKVKVKSQSHVSAGRNFNATIGRAEWEACSATWNLGTNSAFSLGPRKTTENLDRVSRSQDLPDTNWLLASNLVLNPRALTLIPNLCCCVFFSFYFFPFSPFFFLFLKSCFYNHCYVHMIWISTKPCIAPAEGIIAYMNKYAYKYTYSCICDSLIIGKCGSLL